MWASLGIDRRLWPAEPDAALSAAIGAPVYRQVAASLLRRSFEQLRIPLPFVATCYPRHLYERVEGYGGGNLINPDKGFAWKLLAVADEAFFIDRPLFVYRVHANNQAALQRESGALKHLIDQYRATFDTAPEILERAGLVVPVKKGRERFNYLNAMPIQAIHERWIGPHAAHAAEGLLGLKRQLEGAAAKPRHTVP